jgi:hypothetical protein
MVVTPAAVMPRQKVVMAAMLRAATPPRRAVTAAMLRLATAVLAVMLKPAMLMAEA